MMFKQRVLSRYRIVSYEDYKTLNDPGDRIPSLAKGKTEIWYAKNTRDLGLGYTWCKEHKLLPDVKNLEATHVLVGKVKETDLDKIFYVMQGEIWSRNGEARHLISSLGINHTSMSVGDVVKVGNKYQIVDRDGFKELG